MIGGMAIISAALLALIKPLVRPRTLDVEIIALACIFAGIMSIGVRVILRAISYSLASNNTANKKRVLIVGAGQATSQVIKTIQMSASTEYSIIGIIDDDPNKKNFSMHGIKILGNREIISEVCEAEKVDLILFSINNIKPQEKNKILKICDSTNVKVKIVQPLEQAITGSNLNDSLRDVEVEDLLR
jgi:FlaA1/EpsC-like NDP-sugar epimerase